MQRQNICKKYSLFEVDDLFKTMYSTGVVKEAVLDREEECDNMSGDRLVVDHSVPCSVLTIKGITMSQKLSESLQESMQMLPKTRRRYQISWCSKMVTRFCCNQLATCFSAWKLILLPICMREIWTQLY